MVRRWSLQLTTAAAAVTIVCIQGDPAFTGTGKEIMVLLWVQTSWQEGEGEGREARRVVDGSQSRVCGDCCGSKTGQLLSAVATFCSPAELAALQPSGLTAVQLSTQLCTPVTSLGSATAKPIHDAAYSHHGCM